MEGLPPIKWEVRTYHANRFMVPIKIEAASSRQAVEDRVNMLCKSSDYNTGKALVTSASQEDAQIYTWTRLGSGVQISEYHL